MVQTHARNRQISGFALNKRDRDTVSDSRLPQKIVRPMSYCFRKKSNDGPVLDCDRESRPNRQGRSGRQNREVSKMNWEQSKNLVLQVASGKGFGRHYVPRRLVAKDVKDGIC